MVDGRWSMACPERSRGLAGEGAVLKVLVAVPGTVALLAGLALCGGCRETPQEEVDVTADTKVDAGGDVQWDLSGQELTGNERWIQPPGTASIRFYVDDRATKTFKDGDMVWTGSWKWDEKTNLIVFNAAWGPNDGPYPLLYDDGPIAQGGHEMAGAEAGDSVFSAEVWIKAEKEETFQYGVLNELGFWMWEGPNGEVTVPAGSTEDFNVQGLELKPFGDIDIKITMDLSKLHPEFEFVNEYDSPNVYLKGAMNMWTPVQILDAGPDVDKGDDVAGDGIYTFVQSKNLGKHTGLLYAGQHAQFTLMFSKAEETWDQAAEYKLLTEGAVKGVKEGVRAYVSCFGSEWKEVDITFDKDSWGTSENTTVIAECDGEPPKPECTAEGNECAPGEKCIDGKCKVWCDTDEECEAGLKCKEHKCQVWCDTDEECGDGFACINHQCQENVVKSEPKILSLEPDSGPVEGGTLVTLTGTQLADGATVKFGSSAAENVTVLSDTSLTCVTPAGAVGKADVTVANPDGGTDTFIKGFTYIEEAKAPQVDSVDPKEGPVTGGTSVNLYGANFLPNPTVFFGKGLAAGIQFIDSTHVVATTPSGELGKVDVKLVNTDGQEALLAGAFTYVPNTVDYANLFPPLALSSLKGKPAGEAYAEAWEPGITPGDGAGSGLKAQLGFGPEVADLPADPGKWTWADAVYHGESGNNDVWKGALQTDVPGIYRFAFRFSMDGTNWVYADSDGSINGFAMDKSGTWEVKEPGDGPVILGVKPGAVSVLGGTTVTVSGAGFVAGLELTLGDLVVPTANVTDDTIVFTAPKHEAGEVSLTVKNPDGKSNTLAGGLTYTLQFTPQPDGDMSEWPTEMLVTTNGLESNWDPTKNALMELYAAYDDDYFYVAVYGYVEAQNYIVGYLDVDYPSGTGIAQLNLLFDNKGNGDLDDALSNMVSVSVPGYGAEFGFGSRGMSSFLEGEDLGGSTYVGWRGLDPTNNFPWLQGTVACTPDMLEAAIPMATLFPNGKPVGGKKVALFVKVTNAYGGMDGLCNQTLPQFFNPEKIEEVAIVAVVNVL